MYFILTFDPIHTLWVFVRTTPASTCTQNVCLAAANIRKTIKICERKIFFKFASLKHLCIIIITWAFFFSFFFFFFFCNFKNSFHGLSHYFTDDDGDGKIDEDTSTSATMGNL